MSSMIPDRDDIELVKLYVELRRIIDEIVEMRYKALREKYSYKGAARSWVDRSSKYFRKDFTEDLLKEIGVKGEIKAILGYVF